MTSPATALGRGCRGAGRRALARPARDAGAGAVGPRGDGAGRGSRVPRAGGGDDDARRHRHERQDDDDLPARGDRPRAGLPPGRDRARPGRAIDGDAGPARAHDARGARPAPAAGAHARRAGRARGDGGLVARPRTSTGSAGSCSTPSRSRTCRRTTSTTTRRCRRTSRPRRALFTPRRARRGVVNATMPWGRRLLEAPGDRDARRSASSRCRPAGDRRRGVGVGPRRSEAGGLRDPRRRCAARSTCPTASPRSRCAARSACPTTRSSAGIADVREVPGRVEPIDEGQDFLVVVDYAHTPDSILGVLQATRPLATGRLIVVFGCGGDRDRAKRPLMGKAATSAADLHDHHDRQPALGGPDRRSSPRSSPARSRAAAAYVIEPDRRAAIALALAEAGPGDVVVIAGKGHETGAGVRRPDDRVRRPGRGPRGAARAGAVTHDRPAALGDRARGRRAPRRRRRRGHARGHRFARRRARRVVRRAARRARRRGAVRARRLPSGGGRRDGARRRGLARAVRSTVASTGDALLRLGAAERVAHRDLRGRHRRERQDQHQGHDRRGAVAPPSHAREPQLVQQRDRRADDAARRAAGHRGRGGRARGAPQGRRRDAVRHRAARASSS